MQHIAEQLQQAQRIVLLPHEKPDGDALGSCFALMAALQAMGKEVYVDIEEQDITPRYLFMAEGWQQPPEDFMPDLVAALDCGERKMLGARRGGKYTDIHVCIDHHRTGEGFGGLSHVDPSAAATGELVYDLIKLLGVALSKYMALCLYVALASDTGCFKFSNTTDRSFMMAADLWRVYGTFDAINYQLFTLRSKAQMELERYVMDTLEFRMGGKIASIAITQQMRKETGAGEDDIGAFAQVTRSIEGVEIGVTFKEQVDGSWRISMRGGPRVNVSAICKQLGGGGHVRASGCTAQGDLQQARDLVLGVAQQALEALEQ